MQVHAGQSKCKADAMQVHAMCKADAMQVHAGQSKCKACMQANIRPKSNMSLPLARREHLDDHLWRWRWSRWQHLLSHVLHQLSRGCTLGSNIATQLTGMMCMLLLHAQHQAQGVVGQVERCIWAKLSAHGLHHLHGLQCCLQLANVLGVEHGRWRWWRRQLVGAAGCQRRHHTRSNPASRQVAGAGCQRCHHALGNPAKRLVGCQRRHHTLWDEASLGIHA